jgi:hypothetical protein
MLKVIQPVTVWFEGANRSAIYFSLIAQNDNLSNMANFQFYLYDMQMTLVNTGSLNMTGETYQNWDNNEYAYNWAAQELNITIISDYTTTTTTTSTTTVNYTTTTSSTTSSTTKAITTSTSTSTTTKL